MFTQGSTGLLANKLLTYLLMYRTDMLSVVPNFLPPKKPLIWPKYAQKSQRYAPHFLDRSASAYGTFVSLFALNKNLLYSMHVWEINIQPALSLA